MANPNNIDNQNQHPNNTGWESLDSLDENKNRAKQFTNQELERLAKVTGRMPDDDGVVALNLALRYKEYQKYRDIYDEAKRTNTMIQQGTMEDIATAKRELEEAMYLYDQKFENIDNAKVDADTEQKQRELKESYRRLIVGAENRAAAAQNLTDELPDIVDNIQNSEIYKTYELNKDAEPSVKERRAGFTDVGKDGLYDSDNRIDWALYPHAPEISDSNLDHGETAPAPTDTNEVLALPGPVLGETPMLPEPEKHQVDLGEDALKNIEHTIDEDRIKQSKELEKTLNKMTPKLAELYARNRRLIVGAENRAAFTKTKGEYEKLLDESLRLKAEVSYDFAQSEISEHLATRVEELNKEINEKLLEFLGGDSENTYKTQEEYDAEKSKLSEEANKTLIDEYSKMIEARRTKINADFLNDLLKQQSKLEGATIDKLNNGTRCRRFVNKVINNKYLKGALIGAAVAGLAMTGVGLATGAVTVGLGAFSASGAAVGAGRGILMGGLMSRQDAKNSAMQGFADTNKEQIEQKLKSIDVLDEKSDTANVAGWLMEQYSGANTKDRDSNKKRTAVAVGLGAVIGGVMGSGSLQFNSLENTTETAKEVVGREPVEYKPTMFDNVNVPEGGGAYDTFTQMGGNPEDLQRAVDIMHSIDAKYGMVPGSNGETVGFDGTVGDFAHTYPGRIADWPSVANSYMTEVAKAWAEEGLIPSTQTGGEPIYNTVTNAAEKLVPNAFYNFLARGTADVAAGAIGGIVGEAPRKERVNSEELEPTGTVFTREQIQNKIAELRQSAERAETATPSPTREEVLAKLAELQKPTGEAPETFTREEVLAKIAELEQNSPVNDITESIRKIFGAYGDVGEEGLEIMTSTDDLQDIGEDRIIDWWNTLGDVTKNEIRQYELNLGTSRIGNALRKWIKFQSENPNGF